MPTQTPQRLAPVSTAAPVANRTERTLWRWLATGQLTRWRSGEQTLVDLDELEQMLAPRPVHH